MKTFVLFALAVVVPAVAQGTSTLHLNYAYNGAICSTGNSSAADNIIDGSKVLLPVSPYVEQ